MSNPPTFRINFAQRFPHLSRAPIREAVIEVRARGTRIGDKEQMLAYLKPKLADYPKSQDAHGFLGQVQFQPGKEPKLATQDLGWQGVHFTSLDGKNIAKFQRDLFSFSRLEPYEDWEHFSSEAIRLWNIHADLVLPTDVQRLGVRYINRFSFEGSLSDVDRYFKAFSGKLKELNFELAGFLHHDLMRVPGYPYLVNVIRTVQPPEAPTKPPSLILDIDVFIQEPFEARIDLLEERLRDLRWLKNKLFFDIITKKLVKDLQ